jgi:hypothetical protein
MRVTVSPFACGPTTKRTERTKHTWTRLQLKPKTRLGLGSARGCRLVGLAIICLLGVQPLLGSGRTPPTAGTLVRSALARSPRLGVSTWKQDSRYCGPPPCYVTLRSITVWSWSFLRCTR